MPKRWLCINKPKCIYSKEEIIKTKKPLYAMSLRSMEVTSLRVYCKLKEHYIMRYLTECPQYQNYTLFNMPNPQWLNKEPYNNTCKCCKGKGFVIVKVPTQMQKMSKTGIIERFYSEFCEVCNGRGANVPNKNGERVRRSIKS